MWKRNHVGVNVWMRLEGVMADRKMSRKLKGEVLMSCVTLAYLYSLQRVALTEPTTKAADLREQLDQEDCGSEEGG